LSVHQRREGRHEKATGYFPSVRKKEKTGSSSQKINPRTTTERKEIWKGNGITEFGGVIHVSIV